MEVAGTSAEVANGVVTVIMAGKASIIAVDMRHCPMGNDKNLF